MTYVQGIYTTSLFQIIFFLIKVLKKQINGLGCMMDIPRTQILSFEVFQLYD